MYVCMYVFIIIRGHRGRPRLARGGRGDALAGPRVPRRGQVIATIVILAIVEVVVVVVILLIVVVVAAVIVI